MKKLGIVFTLLAVSAAAFWLWYDPDRNVIDDQFTQSEGYRSLHKQWEENKARAIDSDKESALAHLVTSLLSHTGRMEGTLPVRLDSVSLPALLTDESEIQMEKDQPLFAQLSAESIYTYGRIQLNGLSAVLFLVKRPGVYQDVDMLLATVKDSALVDAELLLEYRRNLAEEVSGEAFFENGNNHVIRVTMNKRRFYPVEQTNTISYRYTIEEDGNIETQLDSES